MTTIPPRPTFTQDWLRIARMGGIAAVGQTFIALSNMPVRLDERLLIKPILSMGYLILIVLPFAVGYRYGHQIKREGMPTFTPSMYEVLGGALSGALAGGGLSLLAVLLRHFDLRDPLVNWSPILLNLLTFGNATWFAVIIWIVIGTGTGAAGGLLRLLGPRAYRTAISVAITVASAAVLESLIVDIAKGLGLENLTDRLYASRGGIEWLSAIVLAVASGTLGVLGRGRFRQAKTQLSQLEGTARTQANAALIALTLAALIVLPLFAGKLTNELLANVGIFVLLALGLNIVVGLAGILDLGYVAFFAVGTYTAAVLTAATSPRISPEMPWLLALIFVVVITGLVGLFIGAPVIRMRGDYLAIVTLGFGEIIRLLFLSDWLSGWFNGAQGLVQIPPANIFGLTEIGGTEPRRVFYLVLAFCALAIYVSWRLERSRLGRAWMAVREDETVAEAMGINTVNIKLMAFVVGAMLGSFSGAIVAVKVGSVFPSSFLIVVSMVILVVVIFGGMGNIVGVIAGAAVLIGVLGGPRQPGLLAEFSEFKLLIYGALLIWMMLARPEGLIPSMRRSRELHQHEITQDAWLKN
ncbi:MAG: branched-chain amino acid ABC transporter permease [Acidimicrobiia bacterium]|nr:branched-chain amino acid ABC transporter permease [Acidimicrobiia bacterium]MYC58233.1 branched-chain amino acid ABC transporter permease [Acidimicrobiia bacterium]MYG93623.1 branched-chain amino acid ABC transporter permease [Acidimicrobiia bacterium]MYI30296.1 branched-chain amino acid ABC transporter permease [Acidimicrobiia bacterium]